MGQCYSKKEHDLTVASDPSTKYRYYSVNDQSYHLLLYGYIRECQSDEYKAYKDIIKLITTFSFQGVATIHYAPEDIQKIDINNYSNVKVNFGDIKELVRMGKDKIIMNGLGVFNEHNKMVSKSTGGKRSNNIEIPFEICNKLDNAVEYYSYIMTNLKKHPNMHILRQWIFNVKCNDQYIVKQFGKPFKKHSEPITIWFGRQLARVVTWKLIRFKLFLGDDIGVKTFNISWYNYTSDDIDRFCEIRRNKETKWMRYIVLIKSGAGWCKETFNIQFCSPNWEYTRIPQKLKKSKKYYAGEWGPRIWEFIGPKNEQKLMLKTIKVIFSDRFNPYIKPVDLDKYVPAEGIRNMYK